MCGVLHLLQKKSNKPFKTITRFAQRHSPNRIKYRRDQRKVPCTGRTETNCPTEASSEDVNIDVSCDKSLD
jgi:hypothetical protein